MLPADGMSPSIEDFEIIYPFHTRRMAAIRIMLTTAARPQLPALSYLDIDKVKREEEAYQSRNAGGLQSLPAVTTTSLPYPYPSGPPPPYSNQAPLQHTSNTWAGAQGDNHAQSEPRLIGVDEHDNGKHGPRQSLPSLSEALGVESQRTYSVAAPVAAPTLSALPPQHQSVAPAPSSPSDRRLSGMETLSAPHVAYASKPAYQPHFTSRQEPAPPSSSAYPPLESSRSTFAPIQERPPLQVQTSQAGLRQSPQVSSYQHPQTSPGYEQSSSHSAGPMGPPSFPYGYAPYPSRYTQPGATAGPIYQPSATYPAPQSSSSTWSSNGAPSRVGTDERSIAPYSDSVKRHLDLFDLEAALNEVRHLRNPQYHTPLTS